MKQAELPIKTDVRPVGFPPVVETLLGAIERIVSELTLPTPVSGGHPCKNPKEIKEASHQKGNFFLREILTKRKVIYERPWRAV